MSPVTFRIIYCRDMFRVGNIVLAISTLGYRELFGTSLSVNEEVTGDMRVTPVTFHISPIVRYMIYDI